MSHLPQICSQKILRVEGRLSASGDYSEFGQASEAELIAAKLPSQDVDEPQRRDARCNI